MLLYVLVCIFILAIFTLYRHPLVCVMGDSMQPTYEDGEILVSHRFNKHSEPRRGKVYAFYSPEGRIVIKRLSHIASFDSNLLFFVGDNTDCSIDSRTYGYVSKDKIIAEIYNSSGKEK